MIHFFVHNLWLALGMWVALYISDYACTLAAARLYHAGVNQHFVFEQGYELNPYFQQDIALLKRFSPRFVWALVLTCLIQCLVWFLFVGSGYPEVFEVVIGGFMLLEVAVHVRHFRNLYLFKKAVVSKGLSGTIHYSMWLSLKMSALDLFLFSLLFLFISLLSNQLFFLGGAATCLSTAWNHWKRSYRERPEPEKPTTENAT